MANTVSHKEFFPVLAQAAGNDRGVEFKADATPETAAAIVKALAVSLAKLGGFKSADIFAAIGSAPAKRTTRAKPAADDKPARKPRAATKTNPARQRAAKAATFAKGDKVKALEGERMMNAVVVGLRAEGTKVRVQFVKSGVTSNVIAKNVEAR